MVRGANSLCSHPHPGPLPLAISASLRFPAGKRGDPTAESGIERTCFFDKNAEPFLTYVCQTETRPAQDDGEGHRGDEAVYQRAAFRRQAMNAWIMKQPKDLCRAFSRTFCPASDRRRNLCHLAGHLAGHFVRLPNPFWV